MFKLCRSNQFYNRLLPAVFLLFVAIPDLFAQCAGTDGSIEICDYGNPANQNLNLFSLLGGTPTTGGVWSYPQPTDALDTVTGMLDIWQLHFSGPYQYTYTVPSVPGCTDNTAVVTVIIGPFAGIPSKGHACNDDPSVNLFTFFEPGDPDPQQNGTWSDDDNTGAVQGKFLNATQSGLGTFDFTYTVPAAGNCPESSVTVTVTVERKPIPGSAPEQGYCDNDDFSGLTNLNLVNILEGEDPFGIWQDVDNTGQIFGFFDSTINLQQVFTTFGPGTYTYSYTVYPDNPICSPETANVVFVIEPHIDYTSATLVIDSDICETEMEGATYQAILTQGPFPVPNATYEFSYSISGPVSTNLEGEADFVNGVLTFPIDPENFPEPGDYTVTITQMEDPLSPGYCPNPISVSDVLHIYPLPDIDSGTMTIPPVCLGQDATANLSGSILADGLYDMKYALSGANVQPETDIQIQITGGASTIVIPAALLVNTGTTVFTVTYIKSVVSGCETTSTFTRNIIVNTTPNTAQVQVAVQNACQGNALAAIISGLGSLTNITATYELSGANVAAAQQVVLTAAGGTASFTLPPASISNTGVTTISITGIQNNANNCGVAAASASDPFTINAIPSAPTATDMVFCSAENPTVASLLPSGNNYGWFADATGLSPLPPGTALTNGNYYVSITDPITGCTSPRTMIGVSIIQLEQPVLLPGGSAFCGIDNPTLATLAENLTVDGTVVWYDAPLGGNPLPDDTLLEEGGIYYGFNSDPVNECVSTDGIAVTVTLTDCDPGEYEFMIPDGFSPNGDGVNDTFRIPEIEFLYPGFSFEIYNRYGNLLFKGNSNNPEWDGHATESGTVTSGVVPNGVYFYIVYFNRDNKGPKQGRLYLNR